MPKKTSPEPKLIDFNFTKITNPDNVLYTVTYGGPILQPNLTKILCNKNGDILAYIDIEQLYGMQKKFNARFKTLWFGIQEWHPNLIGYFRTVLDQDYTDEIGFPHFASHPGYWEHDSEKHLYTFTQYNPFAMANNMELPSDWFHVKTDAENDGKIETNFHIFNKGDTRTYEYNTHPLNPTPKIELLTKYILYKDGVITKKQFNKYTRERKKQWRRDTREQQIQSTINKFTMLKNGILTKLKQIVHSEQM